MKIEIKRVFSPDQNKIMSSDTLQTQCVDFLKTTCRVIFSKMKWMIFIHSLHMIDLNFNLVFFYCCDSQSLPQSRQVNSCWTFLPLTHITSLIHLQFVSHKFTTVFLPCKHTPQLWKPLCSYACPQCVYVCMYVQPLLVSYFDICTCVVVSVQRVIPCGVGGS